MEPKRSDRILDEWSSVARSATPPGAPSAVSTARAAGPGISLAGAAVLVVAAVAVFALLGNRPSPSGPGAPLPSPTPPPTPAPSIAVAVPMPSPTPVAPPSPTPEPSTTTSPTPGGTDDVCSPGALVPQITLWEGAAGSRIAHVQLTNTSGTACVIGAVNRIQLVDGDDNVLIDGTAPTTPSTLVIKSSGITTTLVEVGNYCGATPVAPISLVFWLDGYTPTLSLPASQTDTTVPPCNGPGQPGTIQMHPWTAS